MLIVAMVDQKEDPLEGALQSRFEFRGPLQLWFLRGSTMAPVLGLQRHCTLSLHRYPPQNSLHLKQLERTFVSRKPKSRIETPLQWELKSRDSTSGSIAIS